MLEVLLILAVQALSLAVFARFGAPYARASAATRRLQTECEEAKTPKKRDRLFWLALSRIRKGRRSELILVKPETVIRWRKRKFREFWWGKSRRSLGRPAIRRRHIEFIRRISSEHPEYGEDRIALELELKCGIKHSTATIHKSMVTGRSCPGNSQAWRTFLKNQSKAIWSCDFLVQHTVRFRVLYVFVIVELASRKVVHFNLTAHPTIEWVRQQVRNACFEEEPKFLIHDNEGSTASLDVRSKARRRRREPTAVAISTSGSLR